MYLQRLHKLPISRNKLLQTRSSVRIRRENIFKRNHGEETEKLMRNIILVPTYTNKTINRKIRETKLIFIADRRIVD